MKLRRLKPEIISGAYVNFRYDLNLDHYKIPLLLPYLPNTLAVHGTVRVLDVKIWQSRCNQYAYLTELLKKTLHFHYL